VLQFFQKISERDGSPLMAIVTNLCRNFSKTVSETLTDVENRSEKLKGEMQGLEFQRTNAFKAPPREWIYRSRLYELIEDLGGFCFRLQ
jgi:hypothetical protein